MYFSNTNAMVTAKCPYFIAETAHTLSCEGICEDSKNMIQFRRERDKDNYIIKYCQNYPNQCVLCIATDKRYESQ